MTNCKLLCPGMIDIDNCTQDELKAYLENANITNLNCQSQSTSTSPSEVNVADRDEQQQTSYLNDPNFAVLDNIDPDAFQPRSKSVCASARNPLDIHDEYCGPYANIQKLIAGKHSLGLCLLTWLKKELLIATR